MVTDKKIIIPGAAGLVGQNLIIALKEKGYKNMEKTKNMNLF